MENDRAVSQDRNRVVSFYKHASLVSLTLVAFASPWMSISLEILTAVGIAGMIAPIGTLFFIRYPKRFWACVLDVLSVGLGSGFCDFILRRKDPDHTFLEFLYCLLVWTLVYSLLMFVGTRWMFGRASESTKG
jgi:hypothetical protein